MAFCHNNSINSLLWDLAMDNRATIVFLSRRIVRRPRHRKDVKMVAKGEARARIYSNRRCMEALQQPVLLARKVEGDHSNEKGRENLKQISRRQAGELLLDKAVARMTQWTIAFIMLANHSISSRSSSVNDNKNYWNRRKVGQKRTSLLKLGDHSRPMLPNPSCLAWASLSIWVLIRECLTTATMTMMTVKLTQTMMETISRQSAVFSDSWRLMVYRFPHQLRSSLHQ